MRPDAPRFRQQPPAPPQHPTHRPAPEGDASARDSAATSFHGPTDQASARYARPAEPRHVQESEWGSAIRDEAAVTRHDIPLPSFPARDRQDVWDGRDERPVPALDPNGQWTARYVDRDDRPADHAPVYDEPEKKRRRGLISVVLVLVLLAGLVGGQLLRPVPDPTLELALPTASHTFPGAAPVLPWSGQGQSAVAVEGLGTMGSAGSTTPIPTASVAKVMTAYVILRQHPLRSGEQGPEFTVSPQGIAELPMRRRRGDSLLGIKPNQRFTQRNALEALMIISANDLALELARWDSGGNVRAFVEKMNAAARELGMADTTYTDPSGYDATTVSTAADQVKLLTAAMKIPAFAEIVGKRVYVPSDGGPTRQGGNFLLGRHGVIGGKTGYTDRAGGNFVFAARRSVAGVPTTIVGAVMGQRAPNAAAAVSASERLVVAAENALVSTTLAPAGKPVARVNDGLGDTTPLVSAKPVNVVGWPGLTVQVKTAGEVPRTAAANEQVGAVDVGAARIPLRTAGPVEEPDLIQRLLRLG
ncbi:D-alanyl-D-alanine carboxypeptidase family protein [Actinomadura kijaniata]|uniref:D-alanyl-D-alanine carboxypeptidase family protein n=1 Tax=Actinomadura kijaniata TaxID=46161 RepID=UPI001FE03B6D|nr:D-alanyl-D-alanine carboxypeptidase [Actinomadura kijaniata]